MTTLQIETGYTPRVDIGVVVLSHPYHKGAMVIGTTFELAVALTHPGEFFPDGEFTVHAFIPTRWPDQAEELRDTLEALLPQATKCQPNDPDHRWYWLPAEKVARYATENVGMDPKLDETIRGTPAMSYEEWSGEQGLDLNKLDALLGVN